MRCAVSSSVSDRAVQPYRAVEIETKYVDVDGVRYAYRELGPAQPVDTPPLSTSANKATGVKKLRSFTFFAPAKGDFAFEFRHNGPTAASIALNVNVRTR